MRAKVVFTCTRAELEGVRVLRFDWIDGGHRQLGFVAATESGPKAYRNRCPHWNVPLRRGPGSVLREDGARFKCSVHGAEFKLSDGVCVAGPCVGATLSGLSVRTVDDQIEVSTLPSLSAGFGPVRISTSLGALDEPS